MNEPLQKVGIQFYENGIKMPDGHETPDPFLYRFDGKYYLYMTTGLGKIGCYVSEDMLHFSKVDNGVLEKGYCYDYAKDPKHPISGDCPFAPEVCYVDGWFYLISSPSGNGHVILKSDKPEGPYYAITGNLGRRIDGSFFIDSDERAYLLTSGEESIRLYEMEDGFISVKGGEGTDAGKCSLLSCRISGWNEGPYLLRRYGIYYLTYCGAHFLSRDYRVDYATSKETDRPLLSRCFDRKETLLVSTVDDYYGLGHSCTVLGPDLDSYFLCYHNMEQGPRYYNLSRISFSEGRMLLSGDRRHHNPYVKSALKFKGQKLASSPLLFKEHGDCFSVEFNNIGEGRMLLSYQDEDHYVALEMKDSVLSIIEKKETENVLVSVKLNHTYHKDVLHSYLFQYRDGKYALYFDHIEKSLGSITLMKGKIGYLVGFEDIHDTFFSDVALGSSEESYPHTKAVFADGYDKTTSLTEGKMENGYLFLDRGDKASYSFYLDQDSDYQMILRVPSSCFGKRVLVSIDDVSCFAEIPSFEGVAEVRTSVLTINLKKGLHSIVIRGLVRFSELEMNPIGFSSYLSMPLCDGADFTHFRFRNQLNLSKVGMESQNQKIMWVLTFNRYVDCKVDSTILFHSVSKDGFFGVMESVSDDCIPFKEDADSEYHAESYRGILFAVDGNKAYIRKIDYNFSKNLIEVPFVLEESKEYHLAAYQFGNHLSFVINGEEVCSVVADNICLSGSVGLIAKESDVVFKTISIHPQH